jgi:beta-lactamase class A
MAPIAANRRAVLAGIASLLPLTAQGQVSALAALEQPGVRLGVAALDTGSGRMLLHRADERFMMCSTFKLTLAAAILRQVERGEERLNRVIHYTQADLLAVSPVTMANVAKGLSVEALCAAVIHVSDNTAANLLLERLGGPSQITAFFRAIGDSTSRLDRNELSLNTKEGEKDTTTPRAMLMNLRALLLGDVLDVDSRKKLTGWMKEVTTGLSLLRAGLPPEWQIGDKTGRNVAGAINDIAIAWPPGRAPVLICAYTEGANDRAVADIGRAVVKALV